MNKLLTCLYKQIFRVWRPARIRRFVSTCKPQPNDLLLDIGGYPYFWEEAPFVVTRIDTLNLNVRGIAQKNKRGVEIQHIHGDACKLPFPDQSYDMVFSNSVIEHVGSWENQQLFALEAKRVGKKLWIQTPAYIFPLEPHCLAPFIHWLPWNIRKYILRFTPCGLASKDYSEFYAMMKDTRILTKKELRSLFPQCEIHTEFFLWVLPKAYVAVISKTEHSKCHGG